MAEVKVASFIVVSKKGQKCGGCKRNVEGCTRGRRTGVPLGFSVAGRYRNDRSVEMLRFVDDRSRVVRSFVLCYRGYG